MPYGASCWHQTRKQSCLQEILTTKSLRLQTEYMGRVTLPGDPIHITEEHLSDFFTSYGRAGNVTHLLSKVTWDFVLQVTMTRKNFPDIPGILTCIDRTIFVIAEGRGDYCWSCGATGHLSKVSPGVTTKTNYLELLRTRG